MSYKKCLELAGATVHCFDNFGSYQGDWWSKVTYKGQTGWVHGEYGSCAGCDAFESEFGYLDDNENCSHNEWRVNFYTFDDSCGCCDVLKERLIKFALDYLDDILTQEEAEAKAAKNIDWDLGAEEMLTYIKDNACGT